MAGTASSHGRGFVNVGSPSRSLSTSAMPPLLSITPPLLPLPHPATWPHTRFRHTLPSLPSCPCPVVTVLLLLLLLPCCCWLRCRQKRRSARSGAWVCHTGSNVPNAQMAYRGAGRGDCGCNWVCEPAAAAATAVAAVSKGDAADAVAEVLRGGAAAEVLRGGAGVAALPVSQGREGGRGRGGGGGEGKEG